MGLFSLIACVLITLKAFGLIPIGWLLCFTPFLVDIGLFFATVAGGFIFAKKVGRGLEDAFEDTKRDFGRPARVRRKTADFPHGVNQEVHGVNQEVWNRVKDRVG